MDVPLKYLDPNEMIGITGGWVSSGSFASIAPIKPLLPALTAAHEALVAANPAARAVRAPDVAALSEAARQADLLHDHALRAPYYLLLAAQEEALSASPPDVAGAAAYEAASELLFPAGLAGTQGTYAAEVGAATKAAAALDAAAATQKLLAGITLGKKRNGLDLFHAYVQRATELGEADTKRIAAAIATGDGSGQLKIAATLKSAVSGWAKIVKTTLSVLEHVDTDAARALAASVTGPAAKAQQKFLDDQAAKAPAAPPAASGDGTAAPVETTLKRK